MKTTLTKNILLLSAVLLLLPACNGNKNQRTSMSFDETLDIHLKAIIGSNLTALAPTVADSVTLIAPDGSRMTSKESFMKLHENWFKRTRWEWERLSMKTQHTDSMGYALIQYRYTQKDSLDAVTFQNKNYLVLIFRNSPKGWQLVHDQNTGIPM